MSKLREVTSPAEFLQLLESSRLLRPEALARVREAAATAADCRSLARQAVREGWITKWQAAQLLMGSNRFHLGKYVLRNQIGRGDFGRVFLALHPQLERDVAIKTLSRRFTQRPEIVERFLADARKAAALDHPHVLHVYDIDSDEGQFYIVMEPIAGEDLRHRLESHGPLSSDAVLRLLSEAASGLAHAHERGLLHQTLQPASCMLDGQGALKIVGFGMGHLAQADRLTPASDIAPTQVAWRAAFTAPEQLPEGAPSDVRGDLYALGCVAFFALTGQVPRGTGSEGGFGDVAKQLQELKSDVVPGLAELVGKLMAPQPADRVASAADLEQVVRELSESLNKPQPVLDTGNQTGGVQAFDWVPDGGDAKQGVRRDSRPRRGSPAPATIPRLRKRTPWLGFYIALVLTVLVIGAALVYWLTRPPARATSVVPGPPPIRESGRSKPAAAKPLEGETHSTQPDPTKTDPVGEKGSAREGAKGNPGGGDAAPDNDNMGTPAGMEGNSASDASPPADASPPPDSANSVPPNPAAPAAETPAPSPPAPESPKPDAPPPADAPKPDVPPPAETPKPEPPAPAGPPVNPFEGWSESLDLLPADTETADLYRGSHDVGKWLGSPAVPVDVTLLGGSQAGLTAGRFELAAASGDGARGWELVAVEEPASGPVRRRVASLTPAADRLQFAWDAGAAEFAEAGCVANCVLRFSSGTFRHDLRLRKPVESESLQLSLKKQPDVERVKIVAPPPAAQLRFQVTAIDEPLPRNFSLTPADPVALNATGVRVGFGEDPANPVLLLDLKPELKNVFQLQGQWFFRLNSTSEPILWAAKKFQTVANAVATNQEAANLQAQGLRSRLIAAPNDPARATLEGELKLAEGRLAECSQATQAVEWLTATREAIAKGGSLHFRLYLLVEDCEVDLVRSR